MRSPEDQSLLLRVGSRVRRWRDAAGLTQSELARRAGLSVRFLAQVEAGEGNPALTRLAHIARALGIRLERLIGGGDGPDLASGPPILALVGLRGAGKSTLGRGLAERLGWRFVEHDQLVEEESGMSVGALFGLHGEEFYRRAAAASLVRFLQGHTEPAVLATSGGIVTQARSWGQLKRRALTVWLAASPREHWDRVIAQGDDRPMANRPDAMEALERLLAQREPLYAEAHLTVNTSGRTAIEALAELERVTRDHAGITSA